MYFESSKMEILALLIRRLRNKLKLTYHSVVNNIQLLA